MEAEAINGLAREVDNMRSNCPQLYGLIRQYMSVESRDDVAQEVDYKTWM
jgi:hypothetical protein